MGKVIPPWIEAHGDDETIVFKSSRRYVVFKGKGVVPAITTVAQAIKEYGGTEATLDKFEDDSKNAVREVLEAFDHFGLLLEVDPDSSPSTKTLKATIGEVMDSKEIDQSMQKNKLSVFTDGKIESYLKDLVTVSVRGEVAFYEYQTEETVSETLAEIDSNTFLIVAPKTPSSNILAKVNEIAIEQNRRWMQLLPDDGEQAVIGPLFIPGVTGCYNCFKLRQISTLRSSKEAELFESLPELNNFNKETWQSPSRQAALWAIALNLLDVEALNISHLPLTPLRGQCYTVAFSAQGIETEKHRLYKVPRCNVCQSEALPIPQPWPHREADKQRKA